MKRAGILALLLLPCGVVAAQPPLEFKGVPIGATKAELLATLPGFKCNGQFCFWFLQLEPDRVCKPLSDMSDRNRKCREQAILTSRFGPGATKDYTVRIVEDRVASVAITIYETSFDITVAALTEKYGRPTVDETSTVQNRAGATFDNRRVAWKRPDGAIIAQQRSTSVDESVVHMTTHAAADVAAKERANEAKSGAKRL